MSLFKSVHFFSFGRNDWILSVFGIQLIRPHVVFKGMTLYVRSDNFCWWQLLSNSIWLDISSCTCWIRSSCRKSSPYLRMKLYDCPSEHTAVILIGFRSECIIETLSLNLTILMLVLASGGIFPVYWPGNSMKSPLPCQWYCANHQLNRLSWSFGICLSFGIVFNSSIKCFAASLTFLWSVWSEMK